MRCSRFPGRHRDARRRRFRKKLVLRVEHFSLRPRLLPLFFAFIGLRTQHWFSTEYSWDWLGVPCNYRGSYSSVSLEGHHLLVE